ncbi:MAG: hypothetical protein ACLFR2_12215 [Candidatus Kapaibacterium sp.]
MRTLIYIFWLPVFIIAGSRELKPQDFFIAELKAIDTVDNCGNIFDKELITVIDLGVINSKDSLYGYNFQIEYDDTKLYFDRALTINTLSEYLQPGEYQVNKLPDTNLINGYGAILRFPAPPLFGNQPLLALRWYYAGECGDDTTIINLNYIEFTEEFSKNVDSISDAIVYVTVRDKKERHLSAVSNTDSVELKKNDTVMFTPGILAGQETKLEHAVIKAYFENNSFDIIKIEHIDAGIINESSIESDTAFVGIILNGSTGLFSPFSLVIERKDSNAASDRLIIELDHADECACVSRTNDANITFTAEEIKDTANSVVHEIDTHKNFSVNYREIDKILIIESLHYSLRSYIIYDIHGRIMKKEKISGFNNIRIVNFGNISPGAYVIILEDMHGNKEKSLIINYD